MDLGSQLHDTDRTTFSASQADNPRDTLIAAESWGAVWIRQQSGPRLDRIRNPVGEGPEGVTECLRVRE